MERAFSVADSHAPPASRPFLRTRIDLCSFHRPTLDSAAGAHCTMPNNMLARPSPPPLLPSHSADQNGFPSLASPINMGSPPLSARQANRNGSASPALDEKAFHPNGFPLSGQANGAVGQCLGVKTY